VASLGCLLAAAAGALAAERPAPDARPATAVRIACPPLPRGAQPLVEPGAVVLVGEVHGTAEAPAFFASLVCAAAARAGDAGVVVGVEMARSDQEALDAFLAAASPEAGRPRLLAASHFADEWRDGRDSRAMLGLLEDLHRWRAAGFGLEVVAIDVAPGEGTAAEREAAMAERLAAAIAAHPGATTLAYTGNLHSRTVPGAPWDPDLAFMGVHLAARFPRLRAVDFASAGGTAWLCVMEPGGAGPSCGERRQAGEDRGREPFVELWAEADAHGHHGVYYLGTVTASPPAVPAPDAPTVPPR
jgi:hypothetical protein